MNINWKVLDDTSKLHFNEQWNKFIELVNDNMNYEDIMSSELSYIMKQLIYFFDRGYKYKNLAIKNDKYIQLKIINEDIEDDYDNEIIKLDIIKETALSLYNKPEHIYEYIKDSFSELKNTWYGHYYIKYNESISKYELNTDSHPKAYSSITIKNIYNYAKSLVHYNEKEEFKSLPRFWNSLDENDKKQILLRLNWDTDNKEKFPDWFNIMRYLTKFIGLNTEKAKKKNLLIHKIIQINMANILFDVLSRMGILTEFVPDESLTNYSYLPTSTNERTNAILKKLGENVIKNNEYRERWENSFYYINNLEYKYLETQVNKNSINYLDSIVQNGKWICIYAMDWISQIGFYHHYLNNRIMLITGGTGVGKSTQTPKLLLYGLKMIDYKTNGKIVCTQPRIPPTIKNAERIANEMGIPLKKYNNSINNDLVTNNYFVQYKYKKKSHDIKQNGLVLKIVTDGLLEIQLSNPLLKKNIDKNYSLDNIYDIVIIDEAHEHNKNMDMILTKMKYVTYYNNDIKLVIISATMDEDEPIYRRYYRDINDNKMFPLNLLLVKHNLDRINIDRRIHISPPNMTTQYEIIEKYFPDKDPVQIALDIINKTIDGDILLFQPGKIEIKKVVDELNKKTPKNIIALPYHGEMDDDKREFIEDITTTSKYSLVIPKDIQYDLNIDSKNYKQVPQGTYDRIIIVATNIAEASITIDTLKYVIDTGTQKINRYDYKSRMDTLSETKISESSRLQRKGRVGRVGPGTVYYVYKFGEMENNKRQFNISIVDFSDKLFEMLKDNNDDIYINIDPNTIKLSLSTLKDNFSFGFDKIIENQYFTKTNFFDYNGNNKHYDYINNNKPNDFYTTGYSKNTLDDYDGTFYIIHPDELCFKRNILGNIINVVRKCDMIIDNKKYISKKMITFWNILEEFLFIVKNKDIVVKTDFGQNISKLKQLFINMTLEQLICLIYSRAYDCQESVIRLIAMYQSIKSPKDIIYSDIVQGKYKNYFEESLKLYGNCIGDSDSLIKIANMVINFIYYELPKIINCQIQPLNNILKNTKSSKITRELQEQKIKFISGLNTKNFKYANKNIINEFMHLYNTNKLTSNNILTDSELDILLSNDSFIKTYKSKFKLKEVMDYIENWSKKNLLNFNNIMKFNELYIDLKLQLKNYNDKRFEFDYDIKDISYVDMSWFDNHTPSMINKNEISYQEQIKISLLHGFSYKLLKKIITLDNKNFYINIFNPNLDYNYTIDKLFKSDNKQKKILNNTFLKNTCINSIILYISKTEDEFTGDQCVQFIENINSKLISKIIPQILSDYKKYDINIQKKHAQDFLSKLLITHTYGTIYDKIINNYLNSITEIKNDLLNNYDKNFADKLCIIDDRILIKNIILNKYKYYNKIFNNDYFSQFGGDFSIIKKPYYVNSFINLLINELNLLY